MKILHTSDWHIGSTFYGKKRNKEYAAFFAWLLALIQKEQIDVLLIAGDIFDTALPNNSAQHLYYSFLIDLRGTSCKHVVITGGNHDSPSFLNAPQALLKSLNIHVIGAMPENIHDEIIPIRHNGEEIIILAVPYLRERDLQGIAITENYETRAEKIVRSIAEHYKNLTEIALKQKQANSPLLAMGHLYIAGSKLEEEGERELYIGSLARISADIFPKEIDYAALGHIHSAQKIAKTEHIRYSGSPLAMSFAEKSNKKKMLVLDTKNSLSVQEIEIPEFQITRKICGNFSAIRQEIEKLKALDQSVWLEVEYSGEDKFNLKDMLFALTADSKIEILKFKNQNIIDYYINDTLSEENLEDLDPQKIFDRILEKTSYPDEEKQELLACYHEILTALAEKDINE